MLRNAFAVAESGGTLYKPKAILAYEMHLRDPPAAVNVDPNTLSTPRKFSGKAKYIFERAFLSKRARK
jgi:hypothetical protein